MISLLEAVGVKRRQVLSLLNQILRKVFTLRLESKWEYIFFKKKKWVFKNGTDSQKLFKEEINQVFTMPLSEASHW